MIDPVSSIPGWPREITVLVRVSLMIGFDFSVCRQE